jgi:hypothetical protein
LALFAVCCTSGCVGEVVDPDDDPSLEDAGSFVGLDASGAPGQGSDAGFYDGAVATLIDAALDAIVPGPGMDAFVPRDGSSAADARVTADAVAPVDASGPGGPEPARLAGITAAHNAVRARVNTNTPLPPLEWGADIAAVAQAYAEKLAASCSNTLVHSTSQERNGWGENLAMVGGFGGGAAGSAQQAVDLWESEIECYTFGAFQAGVNATCSSQCSSYGGCGHYTQIVWRKTKRVGCGAAECTSGSSKKSYWVCNYDPPGNYLGQLPY